MKTIIEGRVENGQGTAPNKLRRTGYKGCKRKEIRRYEKAIGRERGMESCVKPILGLLTNDDDFIPIIPR